MNKNRRRKIFQIFFLWNINTLWFVQCLELMLWQIEKNKYFGIPVMIFKQSDAVSAKILTIEKNVIFPMSFLWSFIILNLWLSLDSMQSQTFYLYNDLAKYQYISENYGGLIWIRGF